MLNLIKMILAYEEDKATARTAVIGLVSFSIDYCFIVIGASLEWKASSIFILLFTVHLIINKSYLTFIWKKLKEGSFTARTVGYISYLEKGKVGHDIWIFSIYYALVGHFVFFWLLVEFITIPLRFNFFKSISRLIKLKININIDINFDKMITLFFEALGWLGVVGIIGSYFLVTLELINVNSMQYQLMNLTGAVFVALVCLAKKTYQPVVSNTVWAVIAGLGLLKVIIN